MIFIKRTAVVAAVISLLSSHTFASSRMVHIYPSAQTSSCACEKTSQTGGVGENIKDFFSSPKVKITLAVASTIALGVLLHSLKKSSASPTQNVGDAPPINNNLDRDNE